MNTAQAVWEAAFAAPREKRSLAYKQGVLAELERLIDKQPFRLNPFVPGTAECDAWFAGVEEGKDLARQWRKKKKP